jgi:hypothetical protein
MRATEVAMLARRVIFPVLFVFLACAKKEEPQPAAQAAPPPTATAAAETAAPPAAATNTAAAAPAAAPAEQGIATADGETSGVTAVVKELKRSSGGTVSLKLTLVNRSDKKLDFGYAFVDKEHEIGDFASIGGVQLIDPVGKKKYFVARDSEGKCVCSQKLKDVDPGGSVNVWAKFPAPPDNVDKISVIVPHFSPMDDVPISK